MKNKGEIVELEDEVEAEARPNPRRNGGSRKRLESAALGGAVVVGAAGVTFIVADPKVEEWVKAQITKTPGIDSEIKSRNTAGLGALLGGIGLGIAGIYVGSGSKKVPILGEALLGAGAGLGAVGAVQLSTANKLKTARRVMA